MQGEKLTPLDYCTDYPDLANYLRSHGALTGAEMFPPEVWTVSLYEVATLGFGISNTVRALLSTCSGGSRIKEGFRSPERFFDCARARTRGRRRMHAKLQKGGFRGTQGTPLDLPLTCNSMLTYTLQLNCDTYLILAFYMMA